MQSGNKESYLNIQDLHPTIKECLDVITKINIEDFKHGRFDLGSGCFAIHSEYETFPISETVIIEGHKKYVDLQYVVDGLESIFYILASEIEDKNYDESNDVWKTPIDFNKVQRIKLSPGEFLLLYPEDGHGPQYCFDETPSDVKKIVVKIPYGLLKN